MKTHSKLLLTLAAIGITTAIATPARAGVSVSIILGSPLPPPVIVHHPAPPPVVVYQPAPVFPNRVVVTPHTPCLPAAVPVLCAPSRPVWAHPHPHFVTHPGHGRTHGYNHGHGHDRHGHRSHPGHRRH